MSSLTEYTSYADAQAHCTPGKLWELFDGNRERMNIAHECIDRHVQGERTAVVLVHATGADELFSFRQLSEESSRFAHHLVAAGIRPGDRVAVMLEPSRAFYVAMFGAMKMGAIAVPLFTLFGPDGIRLRVQDCQPRVVVTERREGAAGGRVAGAAGVGGRRGLHGHAGPPPRRSSRPTRAATIWRSSSTPRAPRASCRRR